MGQKTGNVGGKLGRLMDYHDVAARLGISHLTVRDRRTGVIAGLVAKGVKTLPQPDGSVKFDEDSLEVAIADCASRGVPLWEPPPRDKAGKKATGGEAVAVANV